MAKMILVFILTFGLISAMLISYRHLSKTEKKYLYKILLEFGCYALLAAVVLTGVVILF